MHCTWILIFADGSPYDGTEFDKDSRPGAVRLCVAGMMVDGYGMLVVDDLETMSTIVRFEGEHIALLHHDPERFINTMYHTENGHPIMPDTDGSFAEENLPNAKEVSFVLTEDIRQDNKLIAAKGAKICLLLTK